VTLINDLPERLRLGTRDLHAQAERAGLMAELLAGRIRPHDYLRLLRNLHALYAALEAALPASADASLLPLPALRREAALAADLAALHGPRWHDELPLHEAMQAYVQRLQAQARLQPRLLMAHAYLRYLGDLHGGQLLQRQVVRALGAPAGLSFYDFGPPERVLALRAQVRDALARLPLQGEAEAAQMVDEARWGFQQHQRLFEGLAAAA
jgi:heme oxygenase (biliverdin-producing, ferredoxin)